MDDEIKDTQRKQRWQNVYSAPRRYDLAMMLVVTTAFALLFAGLKLLDAHIGVFLYLASLILVIGIAQALFFGAFSPRVISMVSGIVYFIVGAMVIMAIQAPGRLPETGEFLIHIVIGGSVQGYLGGLLVAGTFLVTDLLRRLLKSVFFLNRKQSGEGEKKKQSPWDD